MTRRAAILIGVFAVALAVRLVVLGAVWPQLRPDTNPDFYRELGRNWLAGNGLVARAPDGQVLPNLNRPPGYPLFLAGLMAVGGDRLEVLLVANCVLAALTCLLTVVLARRWLGWGAAMIAGLAAAFEPNSVLRCCMVLAEMLFMFWVVGGACLLVWRRDRAWAWCLAGLCWALAALCRPVAVLLPVIALAAAVIWRVRWRCFPLFLAGFLPLIGCWTVRNERLTGHWFFSTAGRFYMVVNWAVGVQVARTGQTPEIAQRQLLARIGSLEFFEGRARFERTLREQQLVLDETMSAMPWWRFLAKFPRGIGETLLGPGARTLETVSWEPVPPPRWWPPLYVALLAGFLVLAAVGALRWWRQLWLVAALAAYFILLSTGPGGHSRYRYPAIPFFAILAVAALTKRLEAGVHDGQHLHHRH